MARQHEINVGEFWAWTNDPLKRYGVKVKILDIPQNGTVLVGDDNGIAPLTVATRALAGRWEEYEPIERERRERMQKSLPPMSNADKIKAIEQNRFINACTQARIPITLHMRISDIDGVSLAMLTNALEAYEEQDDSKV
jgi:hypothetical protein